ncbi:MAG: GDPmannose 4 [Planctomycetota bacterium]|nr:MAG: GDPmannose 4 [Planctomycetota bacterium]
MKRAFITGVGGQDGHYLSAYLRSNGYEVVGCGRPGTLLGARGDELRAKGVRIVEVNLLDRASTHEAVSTFRPDEIYNLAGHSFVPSSWEDPAEAIRITSWPLIHLLETVRTVHPVARLYQSSSSELFGTTEVSPQVEETPFSPANPYAAAKLFTHQMVKLYREHYGLFCVSGIVYNHESPRRPPSFVTSKVVRAACAIKAGRERELVLGDLDVTRDWGFSGDFVEAMWLMLQAKEPHDLVIGTGVPHTVRELCRVAFELVGLDYRTFVRVDESLKRPGQPTRLLANPTRARQLLGWEAKTNFESLLAMMVTAARG